MIAAGSDAKAPLKLGYTTGNLYKFSAKKIWINILQSL